MKNLIAPFNWRGELDKAAEADSIDDDFVLLDNPTVSTTFNGPFKMDVTVGIICISGTIKGKIDLNSYETPSPGFAIFLPEQILEYEYFSDDFSGLFIIMSKRFTDSLDIDGKFPLFLSVRDKPFIALSEEGLKAMEAFYSILQRAVRRKDNPHRIDIVKHLTLAFFYSMTYQYYQSADDKEKTKNEQLVEDFLSLVQAHYKRERGVEFYADKLYLTPKYLSKVIKDASGMSASVWIDNYVVLEAKALLKSTNMTVQQISDELNFPSQSFFGKYFKRITGLSPKAYKNT